MDALVPSGRFELDVLDDDTLAGARRIVNEGTPANTRKAYASDLAYVAAWCRARGYPDSLPMSVAAATTFVVDHVQGPPSEVDRVLVGEGVKKDFGAHAISTVRRRVASLSVRHRVEGHPNPFLDSAVKDLLAKATRFRVSEGWRPRRAAAVELQVLDAMLATCGDDLAGIRDRALLLFGFSSGGRRRSEIVGAKVEQVVPVGLDYRFDMGASKTNQEGEDDPKPVRGRAAVALRRWLMASGLTQGPLFRAVDRHGKLSANPGPMDGRSVSMIVKRRIKLADLDPSVYSGHSLRSGFVTECGRQGVSPHESMSLSGHTDTRTHMRYYRVGDVMRTDAGSIAG